MLHGTNVDVHAAITEDPVAQRLHAQAEVFDPPTEHTFKYLQVGGGEGRVVAAEEGRQLGACRYATVCPTPPRSTPSSTCRSGGQGVYSWGGQGEVWAGGICD